MPISKKIAAFDLDGTLAESKQPITPIMAGLLSKLLDKAMVVVISGGSIEQFRRQFLPAFSPKQGGALLADAPIDAGYSAYSGRTADADLSRLFLLPVSGSQRYEYESATKEWVKTREESFSPEIKAKVLAALKSIESSSARIQKYDLHQQPFGERIEERGSQITFSALGQAAPLDLKKAWDPDLRKRKLIKADLEALLPDVDIGIGGTTSVDVLPKGFSKAEGLKKLLAELHLLPADLIFVGDALFPGGNDNSVLQAGFDTLQVDGTAGAERIIEGWLA